MTFYRHGLSIGIERVEKHVFLSMKAIGKLTHQDYEMINPMIDSTLASVKDPKVKVFLDASELEGWELRAAWDDFKLGLKHGNEFQKIAIFGNKKWQELAGKVGAWFITGDIRYFEDPTEAIGWLIE